MIEADLLHQLTKGEDSRHQFKRDVTNADSLAVKFRVRWKNGHALS